MIIAWGLTITPSIDIDKTTQASNHLVMSKADLAEIMKYNWEVYQLDSIPPSWAMADVDFSETDLLNKLHDSLSIEANTDSPNTVEFWDNNTLDIEIDWEKYWLSIVWWEDEKLFCIEKNWKRMVLAHWKPVMSWNATSRFFKNLYLSGFDKGTKRIFDNWQEFGLIDKITVWIDDVTWETYIKIHADYVNPEMDTIQIDPTIPLSIINDIFDPTVFNNNNDNKEIRTLPLWDREKQALAKWLVDTNKSLCKSYEDMILEWLSHEQTMNLLWENEKKKQEKYKDYLWDFSHIKAIEFTYKPFNE